jgi:hypothetical protein
LTATLLVTAAGVLQAQSGAGNSEPAGGIATAQREFQALRAAEKVRGDELQLQLPDITAPNLQPTPPPVTRPGQERNPPGLTKTRKQKSENWLVDAMMKAPEDPDEPKAWSDEDDPAEPQDPFAELIAETLRPAPKPRSQPAARERDDAREERVIDAPNPFAAYMSAWISPQHRELLLPARQADASAGGRNLAPIGDGGFVGGTRGRSPAAGENVAAWPGGMSTAPSNRSFANEVQPNPFLTGGEFNPPAMLPPMPQADPNPPGSPLPPIPEVARPRSEPPPPLAKPADDAKYFPQLKRF